MVLVSRVLTVLVASGRSRGGGPSQSEGNGLISGIAVCDPSRAGHLPSTNESVVLPDILRLCDIYIDARSFAGMSVTNHDEELASRASKYKNILH